jgi:hypothetical protein
VVNLRESNSPVTQHFPLFGFLSGFDDGKEQDLGEGLNSCGVKLTVHWNLDDLGEPTT